MKSIYPIICCLLYATLGLSQMNQSSHIEELFSLLEENDLFMGSVAIAQKGDIIYEKSVGMADRGAQIPNNSETKFRIGSISKTFTSTLVMMAVESEKLHLETKLSKYFPEVQNANKITIKELLNHRSGISNFTDRSFLNWYTEPIEKAAFLDTIIVKGSDFEPNSDYGYSNSNYVLLTWILEEVYKSSYASILDRYIVDPLNLKNTGYGDIINTAKNEARSYRIDDAWELVPEGHMSIPLGAGGIVSTPSDLCQFVKALFDGKLIERESLEQMKPIGDAYYGFALYGTEFKDRKGWGHGGNIDAFASNLIYFEEEDVCIATAANGVNYGLHDVDVALMSEVFNEPFTLPSFTSIEMTSEELDQYLGVYENDQLPMDMIITKEEATLYLEVVGQPKAALNADGGHQFSYMKYGVKLTFEPTKQKFIYEQEGHIFEFVIKKEVESTSLVETSTVENEDLSLYTGVYTSDQLPIDLTIKEESGKLVGQGDGQPSFPLESKGNHTYINKEIGLTITFMPEENKMSFSQQGMSLEMVKKE